MRQDNNLHKLLNLFLITLIALILLIWFWTKWDLIRIDIKPLSVNEAWQGKRYKIKKYKQYENALHWLLPKITIPEPSYKIYFRFGFSNSLSDWENLEKTNSIYSFPFLQSRFYRIVSTNISTNTKPIEKLLLINGLVEAIVRTARLELAHPYGNYPLKVACLPISPRALALKQKNATFVTFERKTGFEPLSAILLKINIFQN